MSWLNNSHDSALYEFKEPSLNILITGGLGYIGGRLAKYLSERKHTIYLGTRSLQEAPSWLPQATIVQTQWDNQANLNKACSEIDIVIHAAGMNAPDCLSDPAAALEFNGVGTARLLQAAIQNKVRRFVYLSTAHVYCSPLVGTITEKTCPTNLHPYASSHRAGEDIILNAHQQNLIEGVVIRLSNAFGAPAQKDTRCWSLLVNDVCRQVVSTHEMVLTSTGKQRRDFVPLSDVCRAIEYLFHVSKTNLGNGLFNLGGGQSRTIWDMACLIQARCKIVLDFQPEMVRVPSRQLEQDIHFDYRVDRLTQLGFEFNLEECPEIDRLLVFCNDSFSTKQTVGLTQ